MRGSPECADPNASSEFTKAPIDRLPSELFIHILLLTFYMDYELLVTDEDLRSLCLVSNYWRQTVLQCPLFWTCLDNVSHAADLVPVRLRRSENASLQIIAFEPDDLFLAQIFPHILRSEHIQIRAEEQSLLRILNSPLPRLRILELHSPKFEGPTLMMDHSIDLSRLRRFKLKGVMFSTGISGLSNLTALCLADIDASPVSLGNLAEIVRSSPGLGKLKLKNFRCQKDYDPEPSHLPPVNMHHLVSLYLLDVTQAVIDCVLASINAENLKVLILSDDDDDEEFPVRRSGIMQHLTRLFNNGESMLSTILKTMSPEDHRSHVQILVQDLPFGLFHQSDSKSSEITLSGGGWYPELAGALSTLKDASIPYHLGLDAGAAKVVASECDFLSYLPFITQLDVEGQWKDLLPFIEYLSTPREEEWPFPRIEKLYFQSHAVGIVELLRERHVAALQWGREPLRVFDYGGWELNWD